MIENPWKEILTGCMNEQLAKTTISGPAQKRWSASNRDTTDIIKGNSCFGAKCLHRKTGARLQPDRKQNVMRRLREDREGFRQLEAARSAESIGPGAGSAKKEKRSVTQVKIRLSGSESEPVT
ncbi:MAG: hypothetical protein ACLUD0_07125 [Eubacterium ramulus]